MTSTSDPRERDAQRLSAQALAAGNPTGWFEPLYAEAAAGEAIVPWDRGVPHPLLVEWAGGRSGTDRSAVVVGCGYGRDAEFVASLGYATTGFDLSASAIAGARLRYPESVVRYEVADLLDLPADWRGAFELVVESHTVQALPPELHAPASAAVSSLVSPDGTLVVLGEVGDGAADGPPWPLTREELDGFAVDGVQLVSVERTAGESPRWRAEFRR